MRILFLLLIILSCSSNPRTKKIEKVLIQYCQTGGVNHPCKIQGEDLQSLLKTVEHERFGTPRIISCFESMAYEDSGYCGLNESGELRLDSLDVWYFDTKEEHHFQFGTYCSIVKKKTWELEQCGPWTQ
jgi:hypothetical protein